MRVLRTFGAVALAAALVTGAAGCGGGDSDEPEQLEFGTEKGDLNPEDVRASDSEVAAGFAELSAILTEVAQQLGKNDAAAVDAQEKILPVWESILGTVKANAPSSYETLNQAFAFLMSAPADAPKALVDAAVTAFRATSAAYLKLYPVSSSSPDPESTATDDPSPSEAPPADDGPVTGY